MKQQNFTKGKNGEEIARSYLIQKGYQLVEQNYSNRFGEIDLIFVKQKKLIFVEVKLKVGEEFGTPEEMIGKRKLFQVEQTAVAFLQKNPKISKNVSSYQIDAVCIVTNEKSEVLRINHYKNITF